LGGPRIEARRHDGAERGSRNPPVGGYL